MNRDTPLDAATDPAALKRAYSCFPSGVVAVCRQQPTGEQVGMSASAFTTVSLQPPLVSICVRRESVTWPQLRGAAELGISVFAANQGRAARQLAGPPEDRFTDWKPLVEPGGALFLPGAAAHLLCTLVTETSVGDHTLVVLQIQALRSDPGVDPLVFHASTFRALEGRRE